MDQKATFLETEGDTFFRRNERSFASHHAGAMKDPKSDPVIAVIDRLRPKRVLEVGCANGWKLDVIRRLYGADVAGIDPSAEAIAAGFPGIDLKVATADALPFADAAFDCVVFGFCLYLCDRADLFKIASEADRVLAAGGHIVIYEFFAPVSHVRPYHHRDGVLTHKMDFSRLWSWHPAYALWSHEIHVLPGKDASDPNEWYATSVVRKGHG